MANNFNARMFAGTRRERFISDYKLQSISEENGENCQQARGRLARFEH